jgi:NTE family protein
MSNSEKSFSPTQAAEGRRAKSEERKTKSEGRRAKSDRYFFALRSSLFGSFLIFKMTRTYNHNMGAHSYPRLGLALSGGAARGLAHIGVLKVLAENKIPISFIAATSIGSVIGAAYASGVSIDKMVEVATRVRWRDLGQFSLGMMGLSDNTRMEKFLASFIPVRTFDKLNIPLRITTTDLMSGERVVFKEGDLFTAIRASCALPGVYAPVSLDGKLLVDGGLTSGIPCRVAHAMGADVVIAVDIRGSLSVKRPKNMFQVVMQSFAILGYGIRDYQVLDADLVITPNVSDIGWDELERAKDTIAAGEMEARRVLPEILRVTRPRLSKLVSSMFKASRRIK